VNKPVTSDPILQSFAYQPLTMNRKKKITYHTSLKGSTSFPCICRMVWHMHGAMYRVVSICFTHSSVVRRQMRIVLSCCDVIILKNFIWRSCNEVIAVGTPAIRHIHVNISRTGMVQKQFLLSCSESGHLAIYLILCITVKTSVWYHLWKCWIKCIMQLVNGFNTCLSHHIYIWRAVYT
jgi:hypothetical protein